MTALSCKSESPFILKPTQEYLLLGSGALTGVAVYYIFDQDIILSEESINSLTRYDVNAFDRSAVDNWSLTAADYSEVAMALSVSAILPLLANSDARSDALTIGVMSAETMIWAVSLPQLFKVTASRNRPYVYNESIETEYKLKSRATESFFSRTTTVAFASAVFSATLFDAYYPNSQYSKIVWLGSLTCATFAGYLKFYSGQHFATDILTGAVVGSLIGWFVPYIHRNDKNVNNKVSFGISPVKDGMKAAMVVKF